MTAGNGPAPGARTLPAAGFQGKHRITRLRYLHSRSAAAWHLQRLDADGLIESDRDGRAVRYALTDEALEIFVVLERGDHGRAC